MIRVSYKKAIVYCATIVCVSAQSWGITNQIDDMKNFFATNSLQSIACYIRDRHVQAPLIHSQWYVDRMTNTHQQCIESAFRDVGKSIAYKLTNAITTANSCQPYDVYDSLRRDFLMMSRFVG